MPVPQKMADLFTLAASNSPAGSEAIGNSLDDYIRAGFAISRSTNALASASIAAASTTDIGSADAESVQITGSATITSLGTTASGIVRECRFTGNCTITNSSSISLPASKNISTINGDVIIFRSLGSGNWVYVGGTRGGFVHIDGSTAMSGGLQITPPTLGGGGSSTSFLSLSQGTGSNNDTLTLSHFRASGTSDWNGVVWGIARMVDSSNMGYINFGPDSAGVSIKFGHNGIDYATQTTGGQWRFNGLVTASAGLRAPLLSGGSGTVVFADSSNTVTRYYISGDNTSLNTSVSDDSGNFRAIAIQISRNDGSVTLGGNGSTVASNQFRAGRSVQATGATFLGSVAQGAYMSWNDDNGSGRTFFTCHKGGGSGGYFFRTTDGTNFPVIAQIDASGNITANNFTATSDARLKDVYADHEPRDFHLALKRFRWKDSGEEGLSPIAQDVLSQAPEYVLEVDHKDLGKALSIDKASIALEWVANLAKRVAKLEG